MKKWSEIRQGIINKLFMDEAEVNSESENYASKFAFFANECLNQIANSVKPRIAVFDIDAYSNVFMGKYFELKNPKIEYLVDVHSTHGTITKVESFDVVEGVVTQFRFGDNSVWQTNGYVLERLPDDTQIDGNVIFFGHTPKLIPFRLEYDTNKWVIPDTNTIYSTGLKKFIYDNKLLTERQNVFYINETIRMPEDFLSFADMVNYHDNEADPTITYVSDKTIIVSETGSYKIFYNALWEPITEDYMNDQEQLDLPIDQSVLNCIPTYVAAQILAEDDVQRSTILKNEYELMLSRLDTNIMYQENHYKSTGGWY